jgi:DNA-binding transcriptional LysR family regulator
LDKKNFGVKRLNLDYLDTLSLVVSLGSFSEAAERRNLTQPAVSQQVRQLERSLGVQLIERVGRRARPTAAGELLLSHAMRIEADVTAAIDAMDAFKGGVGGRVRLGTGATACAFFFPPLLGSLRAKFPLIDISVMTGNTADVVRAVEENVIDIGFVTLPVAGRSLEIIPVMEDEFVLIARPEDAVDGDITPARLTDMPVILFESGGNTRFITNEWLAGGGASIKPVMSLGSVEATKELVAAGLGAAVLPGMAVQNARDRHRFSIRTLTPPLARRLAIVVRRDKPLHRGLKELIQAIRQAVPGHI